MSKIIENPDGSLSIYTNSADWNGDYKEYKYTMPLQYDPLAVKHSTHVEPDSLTEQEHKDSCDINKMVRRAANGQQIRGGPEPVFGYDDLTIDALQHRINLQKAKEIELNLQKLKHEIDEGELNGMQLKPDLQKKLGFKTRKKAVIQDLQKTNELNEQKLDPPKPAQTPEPKP